MTSARLQFSDLKSAAAAYESWLRDAALPLWSTVGMSQAGIFEEAIGLDGQVAPAPHRARVQARQTFVFASAKLAGFGDRWLTTARKGFAFYRRHYRRPDGLFVKLADHDGNILDPTTHLYEQAFSLLAMGALYAAMDEPAVAAEGERTAQAMDPWRLPAGGWRETGPHPFQANAHMHLLEACLAWEEAGAGRAWAQRADEIVELALKAFIDPRGGFLREFFDADWSPVSGPDGRVVEPGHQCEWAWLMERWGRLRGDPRGHAAAVRLFEAGVRGRDPARGVLINSCWDDMRPNDPHARLWPQTEYLKAALILGREDYALDAARTLARYLDVPTRGAWRDVNRPDGTFVDEPAPASSFYHIMAAILELRRWA